MKFFILFFLLIVATLTGCVSTVEPSAEDELLIKGQENVEAMP